MKESFLIYKSFYPAIEDLTNEQLGKLFRAIFEYQITETDCTDPDIMMAFKFFKNQFRLDAAKYEKVVNRNRANGLNGGRPKTEDNPNNPLGFSKPKKADNDNEKDNDNDKEKELLFERFWNLYDKKEGRKDCERKFAKLKQTDIDKIFETLPAYIASTPDKKYRKMPETYLNGEHWNDEIASTPQTYTKAAPTGKDDKWYK